MTLSKELIKGLNDGTISVGCGPIESKPWTEQEKLELKNCLDEIFDKRYDKRC